MLKKNIYNFGYHLKYSSDNIDIKTVIDNITYKLKFKT